MRFSTIVTFALAGLVASVPAPAAAPAPALARDLTPALALTPAPAVDKRDLVTIEVTITIVTGVLGALVTELVGFTGGALQCLIIRAHLGLIPTELALIAAVVHATASLTLAESLALVADLTTIANQLEILLADTVNRAAVIVAAGLVTVVHDIIVAAKVAIDSVLDGAELIVVSAEVAAITSIQARVDAAFIAALAVI